MSLHGYAWMMADYMYSLNGGNEMPSYGFTASGNAWCRGYVTAENKEEAIKKILNHDYDDVNEEEITDILNVDDIWEC